ncbi:spop [Symbiodinium sp. CCMP2456]|nr:spop [Symbiodinium sp. CCMP2456]
MADELSLYFEFQFERSKTRHAKGCPVQSAKYSFAGCNIFLDVYPYGSEEDAADVVRCFLRFAPSHSGEQFWSIPSLFWRISFWCGKIEWQSTELDGQTIAHDKDFIQVICRNPGQSRKLHTEVHLWCDPKECCDVSKSDSAKRRRVDYGAALWEDMKFTDMVICSGEESQGFPCHRAVLAKSSEVFDRMLSSEMKESSERRLVLQNICEETLKVFLEYIYTGCYPSAGAKLSITQLGELMSVGEMYSFPMLVLAAGEQLCAAVSPTNVPTILGQLRKFRHRPCIQGFISDITQKIKENPDLLEALVAIC